LLVSRIRIETSLGGHLPLHAQICRGICLILGFWNYRIVGKRRRWSRHLLLCHLSRGDVWVFAFFNRWFPLVFRVDFSFLSSQLVYRRTNSCICIDPPRNDSSHGLYPSRFDQRIRERRITRSGTSGERSCDGSVDPLLNTSIRRQMIFTNRLNLST